MAVATNLGTGGSVLDAQYGSSVAPNTNEPLLLGHTGENYLYLPGVGGNYASTPDAAALDITGDIDIRVRVALDDWTPSADSVLVGKFFSAQISYAVLIATDGKPYWAWSTDGSTSSVTASTIAPPFVNGVAYWVRVAVDVNISGTDRSVSFYYAADSATEPSSWTLHQTITLAGTTSLYSGTADLHVGAILSGGSANVAAAKFYRAVIYSDLTETTKVFDADFTSGITSGAQTTFTESSANAATVTINRSTAGRKSCAVVRPVWLLGTDDYFEVADNALLNFGASDSFTVVAVVRQWGTPSFAALASKKAGGGTSAGYWLVADSGSGGRRYLEMGNGATDGFAVVTSQPFGTLDVVAGVRASGTATAYNDGVAGTGVATALDLNTSNSFRVGAGGGGNYADAELLAVAVFRRALSASELATIATYYGAV